MSTTLTILNANSRNLWTETAVCKAHVPCPSSMHRHRKPPLPKWPTMTASLSTKNSGNRGTSPGRPTFRSAQRPVSPFVVVPCSQVATSAERTFVPPADIYALKNKTCPAPPADTPTGRDCLAATPPGTILNSHRGVAGFYSGHTPRLQDFALRPQATWYCRTMPPVRSRWSLQPWKRRVADHYFHPSDQRRAPGTTPAPGLRPALVMPFVA